MSIDTSTLAGKVRFVARQDDRVLVNDYIATELVWRYFYSHLFEPSSMDRLHDTISIQKAMKIPGLKEVRQARKYVARKFAPKSVIPEGYTPYYVDTGDK